MKASPLAHLSKWRRLAPAVALLVVAFALVAGPVSQALAQDGPQAFAVYCETDKTLTFYKASDRPAAGTTYKGKAATKVFDVDENDTSARRYSPFNDVNELVTKVVIAEPEDQGNKLTPKDTSYWFYGFENLVEVDGWENADTSQNTNTSYMYANTDLSNGLSAPEFDTSSVTNMSYMFYQCTGLRTPDFSHWNVSKVENMDSMFKGARGLTTPNFNGWNLASVKNMSGMFYTCVALESVDFSGWNMPQLADASAMFSGCSSMTSVNVSNWNAPSLTNVQEMFKGCSSLTTLDFSSWTAGTIEKAARLVYQCSNLMSLDISSLGITENANYNTLMYIFAESALEKVTLGEGWRFTDYGSALPNVDGKLWYKADADGNPMGRGYTPTELRNNWDAATMAGTWVLSDEVPEPPAANTAFAVYCDTDKTLTLYKDVTANVPSAGSTYNGKAATQVFVIDETVTRYGDSPFAAVANVVENVEIAVPGDAGKIAPLSTDHWFEDFENLQEVDGWENADTSKVASTSYMYYNTDLSNGLSAPEFDTSSVTNMSYMFAFCSGLATPDFSSWDTSKVTDMTSMFQNCSSLSAPKLSGWNVTGVTSMQNMFYGCGALSSLDLSAWEPSKVTTMKQMFYQCTALTSLDFSGWNTPELTNLNQAFFQDAALTSLNFEDWSAPKISNLQSTFNQCSALTELDLSSWGASKVTDTSSTFLGCTSLATLDLSGIGANGKYGYTFDRCPALSKVTLGAGWSFGDTRSLLPEAAGKLWYKADADGNPTGDGYTSDELAEAWDGATMAGTWVLSDAPAAELEAFAVYSSTDNTLTLYKASDKPAEGGVYNNKAATHVFDIDEQATRFSASPFADVEDQVTKVIIAAPENADNKLTPKSMNRWFYNFTSLEQVDGWANADTSQVTNMSYMFYRCNLSKGLDAPNLNTSAVTNMSNMFYGCKGLSSATGPDLSQWDVSNVTDMSSMFRECTALQAPKTSGWDTSSVENMSDMFRGCSSIVTFDLTPWDLSSVEFANRMFSGCSKLTTITLPNENMTALTSANDLFYRCAALTTVNASTWVAPALTSASNMFYDCGTLTSLDLSNLGAAALEDTDGMFCGCSALATLDLSGIGIAEKPIMSAMFTGCSALSKVTLGADWSFADDRGALPSVEGKLWYKADAEGNPAGTGYTGDELATEWDGATMAGTWVLSEPISEPVVPEAFAIYDSSDKSLTIYKASDKPEVGDTYNGKTVSQVFGINEETEWFSQTPFYSAKDSIEKVIFAEPEDQNNKIAPVSMRKWFDSVNRLKSIEGWENVDGSNLTDMSYLFYGTRLASIDLSALKAPKLETIESMFGSCLELKTANLSGLVTASTTDASNLFLGCSNLESVDVSKWDTSGMESMTSVFQRCRDLTELDLSSWTTTDAVNMKWMFDESGITKVTLGTGFSFGSGPSQTGLPDAKGCLWYKLDDSGSPVRPGYTGEELATSWDGSTMAGTWQLTTELEEPEPKPVELADLTASDSLTYGETLTVTFTPKSGDDVIASGTATLKLGDTVLATVGEPEADGSFSLSYNTAEKGVALGEQTLTVTFESTGYEAATGTVETTLSAKALTVEVTSSLDKTWDGSDEVDGLAVELLGALEDDDVTVSATGAYASSDAGEQDVTLTLALSGDDAAWYTVSAPTDLTGTIDAADIAGKLSLSGTPAFGETLTATYEPTSGEQVSYTWTRDGQVIDGATGSTYTLAKEDVGAQIAVVATASDANHTGSVTSDAVTVAKATQDAPAAPVGTATSHTTIEVEALADSPAGAKAEYSIDGGKTWQTETTFSGLEPETEYTVIARFQELDTHEASEVSEGTTVSTPAAPLPTFTVSVSAEGQGTVDGGGTYEQGTSVTVTATAAEGHHFVAWLVDGEQVSTEASYTFVVETDVALVAQFEQDEPDTPDPDDPDTPDPDDPDTPDNPDPEEPDKPDTPDPDKPADTKPGEQPKPEIPATGDAGAVAALVTALVGAGALGLGAYRRRS